MASRRFTRLLLVGLLTLLTVTSTLAAKPVFIDIDVTFDNEFVTEVCGFPVETHIEGRALIRERDTQTDANLRYEVTWTNQEAGTSITMQASGVERIASTDTTITYSFSGGDRIVVPGEGAVHINVGRYVVTSIRDPDTGEFTDAEVVRQGRADELSAELVCTLLAP